MKKSAYLDDRKRGSILHRFEPDVGRAVQGPQERELKQKHRGGHQNCPHSEMRLCFQALAAQGKSFFNCLY